MDDNQKFNHNLASIGEALLLVWWGLVILIDPLTIGIGAIGTGLILLGVNAVRMLKGIPPKEGTTQAGITAIVWGMLYHVFALSLGASFALLLIIIGLISLLASLFARPNLQTGNTSGDV